MTDLTTVLARIDHQITQDGCEGQLADCDVADQFMDQARSLLAVPAGKALAAFVEAALRYDEAMEQYGYAPAEVVLGFHDAADTYREATR